MRQIREIMRLRKDKQLSYDKIGQALGMSKRTAIRYMDRAEKANLTWPIPETMDDEQLERLLFPTKERTAAYLARQFDFDVTEKELKSKKYHVTRQLLWKEYQEDHPGGYSYQHFCRLHRTWRKSRTVSMRQEHPPGKKLFVDFAGDTMEVRTGVQVRSGRPRSSLQRWGTATTRMSKRCGRWTPQQH